MEFAHCAGGHTRHAASAQDQYGEAVLGPAALITDQLGAVAAYLAIVDRKLFFTDRALHRTPFVILSSDATIVFFDLYSLKPTSPSVFLLTVPCRNRRPATAYFSAGCESRGKESGAGGRLGTGKKSAMRQLVPQVKSEKGTEKRSGAEADRPDRDPEKREKSVQISTAATVLSDL